jgi:hypothetical protein
MRHGRWAAAATTLVMAAGLAAFTSGAAASAATHRAGPAPRESASDRMARKIGLQVVPKRPGVARKAAGAAAAANPMLSLLPDPALSDMSYWSAKLTAMSARRASAAKSAAAATTKAAVEPLLVDEKEPDAIRGGNDTPASAELIGAFGSASGKRPAARILGTIAPSAAPAPFPSVPEDNGSITRAGATGLKATSQRTTTGTIGDGPHGSAGDGSGDFDYYTITSARAGQRLVVDIDAQDNDPANELDSVVILWDAGGNEVAFNDDSSTSLDSLLNTVIPANGTYYVSVQSFGSLPGDPFNSGSGSGAGSKGTYTVTFGLDANDVDYYAVHLRAGDVLSGSAAGSALQMNVYDTATKEVFGSSQDASGIYPILSPLAGGGNAVIDHVARSGGTYYVALQGTPGNYDTTLEVYRPKLETTGATQTIFLDFDGARVNTAAFGGPGVRQLSPLPSFLGRWGIPASRQNAVIDRVISTVTENLKRDFTSTGSTVKILNSRDNADTFGRPNVSRLIIGGTIEESGVDTIGIAQSIDPGNFDTAETALILLDVVSGSVDDWGDASFNAYLTPASNRVRFVGTALGNIASHEAGHYLGNWHVDQFDGVYNLMDQGGNFPMLYGVGPDGVGGTADDPDVDFGPDTLNPNEGFTGTENTRTRTRWGLSGGLVS